jgi:hypothetical protein
MPASHRAGRLPQHGSRRTHHPIVDATSWDHQHRPGQRRQPPRQGIRPHPRNPARPQRFAAFLRSLQAEAVILDPLAPLLATLGLDENSNTDVALFFSWWSETLQIADVTDDLVVHHTGHAGQRSRGASRLLDEPDAIWTLTKGLGTDPAEDDPFNTTQPRFLSAYGRDVDHPEEGLDYDPDTGHLAFNGQNRSQTKAVGKVNHITDILQDQTPRSINQICQAVGGDRNKTYAAVKKMVDDGSLFEVSKSKNGHPLYVVDTTK